MALLVVLLVLLLGYRINSKVYAKEYKLKRSVGWVSYVMLGADGAISVFFASLLLATLYLGALYFELEINSTVLNINLFKEHVNLLLSDAYLKTMTVLTVFITSIAVNELRLFLMNRSPDLNALKALDGIMNITLTALENSSYLKISLKSGKIYVGVLFEEQFASGDSESLIIIPMISGYRDENLKMHLDCNYLDVYLEQGIVERIPGGICYRGDEAQAVFMLIPVSEIESISLFDVDLYDKFKYDEDAGYNFKLLQSPPPISIEPSYFDSNSKYAARSQSERPNLDE